MSQEESKHGLLSQSGQEKTSWISSCARMKGIGVHIVYVLNSEDEDAYIILSVMIYFYEKKYNYLFQLQTCFVYNAYSKLIH